MTLRALAPADRPHLLDIARALPGWFTDQGIAQMRVDLAFQHGFVAVDDLRPVGFLTFYVTEAVAWIGWLGVLPSLHRRGVGRSLVERLAAESVQAGARELRVNTLGDAVAYEPYARTRAFYRALGFRDAWRTLTDDPECRERLTLARTLG